MRRRRVIGQLVVLGSIGLAGCTSIPGVPQDEYDIGMSANAFQPAEYTTEIGSPIRWFNDGSRAHTITAYDEGIPDPDTYFATGGFDTESAARAAWTANEGGSLAPGEAYEHTFSRPGRYAYFCIPHEPRGMVGAIDVVG